ncbi:MAG TPA: hypothetical protein VJ957_11155 [Longimicrobiales bacterium]|nr:hypothetical protein [Longimicrobiales bacterium]
MRRAFLIALVVGWPAFASGQSLAGSYVYTSDAGPVRLVLEQHGQQVRGTMTGADGNRFQLAGTLDGGRATGAMTVSGGSGWFAAGAVNGQLLLVVAELDDSGQPDLSRGWTLRFDPVAAAGDDAAANADVSDALGQLGLTPPAGSTPGPAGAASAPSPRVQQWQRQLSGKRLTYMESYSSSGGGSYGGYSNRWDAYLCSDGTFYFQQNGMVSADAGGGTSGYAGGSDGSRGQWQLVERNGQVVLQYRMADGSAGADVLTYRDGKTFLGQNRVFVTAENPYCR